MKKVSFMSLVTIVALSVAISSIVSFFMMANVTKYSQRATREYSRKLEYLTMSHEKFMEDIKNEMSDNQKNMDRQIERYQDIWLGKAVYAAEEEFIKMAGSFETVKLPSFTVSYYRLGDEVIVNDIKQTSIKFAIKFGEANVTGNEKIEEGELPYLCRDGNWIYQYSIYEGARIPLEMLNSYLDQHR